jgi:hypothetical protein
MQQTVQLWNANDKNNEADELNHPLENRKSSASALDDRRFSCKRLVHRRRQHILQRRQLQQHETSLMQKIIISHIAENGRRRTIN